MFIIKKLDVRINVVASETKVSIEAVASTGTLITDSTVGTGGGLSVRGSCWGRVFSCDCAFKVSLCLVRVGRLKEWLTARIASSLSNELQHCLLSSVVTISELDFNNWLGLVGEININLNFRNSKVRQGFQGILNRVRVFGLSQTIRINLDGAGIVLAAKLVSETQLEERLLGTSNFELARQLLEILTTIGVTLGLRIITPGTPAEGAIVTFVTSITMALLVLEPWPVNTPSCRAASLRVIRNLAAIFYSGSLANVVERVSVSAALSVATAVIGASGSAATFTSEGRETFALTSGTITQTTSTTLAVNVLVVKSCVLSALQLFASWSLFSGDRHH